MWNISQARKDLKNKVQEGQPVSPRGQTDIQQLRQHCQNKSCSNFLRQYFSYLVQNTLAQNKIRQAPLISSPARLLQEVAKTTTEEEWRVGLRTREGGLGANQPGNILSIVRAVILLQGSSCFVEKGRWLESTGLSQSLGMMLLAQNARLFVTEVSQCLKAKVESSIVVHSCNWWQREVEESGSATQQVQGQPWLPESLSQKTNKEGI